MASNATTTTTTTTNSLSQPVISNGVDPTSTPNTTFIQADLSTFRSIVQKLTGAPEDPSTPKLPITLPSRLMSSSTTKPITTTTTTKPINATTAEMGPRKSPFKLHERRQSMKKLKLKLNNNNNGVFIHHETTTPPPPSYNLSPHYKQRGFLSGYGGDLVTVSPVSPLDHLFCRGSSPRTPPPPIPEDSQEEIRAIAEKGFYLHPSPVSTPRESEPELLPLFPLHSPRDHNHHSSSSP